ncbi:MAG: rhomboid family intramembrane serine protease [Phycisphaerales bacterium]
MGLADREYARESSGRGFDPTGTSSLGRGLRGWSMNAWIIAVCIGVFVLDMLLAGAGVTPTVSQGRDFYVPIDRGTPVRVVQDDQAMFAARNLPGRGNFARPIVIPADQAPSELAAAGPQPARVIEIEGDLWVQAGEVRYRRGMPLRMWGEFSTGKGFLELQVWRLVTFQFLHADINHLILNMVGLFFFGSIVESRIGSRRYLSFFLACGIGGALLYLVLNLLGSILHLRFYGLLNYDAFVPLIGASGGVFGVLMAAAYYARAGDKLLLFFVIPVPVKLGAYGLVGVEFARLILQADNAGGSAAHIGGAIAGFFLIRRIGVLDEFLDFFGGSGKRGAGGGGGGRRGRGKRLQRAGGGATAKEERRLDELLEKVNRDGLHSLTDEERAFLNRVSRGKREG